MTPDPTRIPADIRDTLAEIQRRLGDLPAPDGLTLYHVDKLRRLTKDYGTALAWWIARKEDRDAA